jgi:hypothetical protein
VAKHSQILAVKEVEYPVLDTTSPCPQLMTPLPEIIRFWTAEFMPHLCQALDPGNAFRIRAPNALAQRAEALKHQHTLGIILIEHHGGLRHP